MRIDVTHEDLLAGKRLDTMKCPIAIAVSRVAKTQAIVCRQYITIGDKNYVNPPTVRYAVRMIDEYRHVEPFSFELPIELNGRA